MLEELADDALEPLHHHRWRPALLPRRILHREVGEPWYHQVIPTTHRNKTAEAVASAPTQTLRNPSSPNSRRRKATDELITKFT
uniref:Uncharacterized protein n=1 Tax=Arundo donax TaxID=35708 RepID=A0A0A9FJT1_ARUDO